MTDGIDPEGRNELDSILRRLTLLGEHVSVMGQHLAAIKVRLDRCETDLTIIRQNVQGLDAERQQRAGSRALVARSLVIIPTILSILALAATAVRWIAAHFLP
jgi:hypothetical protein